MPIETKSSEIGKKYAAAHLAQYGDKDLSGALDLYTALIATHPDTPEAGYSRSQVKNIVHSVVPEQELLDAHVALLSACFARQRQADASATEVDS